MREAAVGAAERVQQRLPLRQCTERRDEEEEHEGQLQLAWWEIRLEIRLGPGLGFGVEVQA